MVPLHKYANGVPPDNSTAYQDYVAEGRGEASYVITMLVLYAVSIAFMIGYMSFKKNKYRQWDREANQYLNTYYKRQIKHEKVRLQTFAYNFNPGMTVLFATGLAMGNVHRPKAQPKTSGEPDGGRAPPPKGLLDSGCPPQLIEVTVEEEDGGSSALLLEDSGAASAPCGKIV